MSRDRRHLFKSIILDYDVINLHNKQHEIVSINIIILFARNTINLIRRVTNPNLSYVQ